jgi:Lrp/AsnC family transcriptional regulator, regulator for asnA, asnC and gidA
VDDKNGSRNGDLDAIDRLIMGKLQENGRRSNASISRALGISQSTVKKRIDRLVESGMMRVLAVIDPVAFGHGQHMMIGINVKPGYASAVGDALASMPEVSFVAYLVGRYDVWAEVFAPDNDSLLRFISERMVTLDDITRIETFSVLRNQKVDYYNWSLQGELHSVED